MKKKIVTALMTAALGTSLLFSQAAMAADNTAKTEDTAETDSTDAAKEEELKTIGEKPEEDKEGVLSVKLKNLTGKVITGVTVKNEKDEKYPDNFLKDEDKFETDEERVLWFDPNAKDEEKDAEAKDTEETKEEDSKDAEAEKEVPKYNIQLTFEDETTAEIHTFPFGDTEEAELIWKVSSLPGIRQHKPEEVLQYSGNRAGTCTEANRSTGTDIFTVHSEL